MKEIGRLTAYLTLTNYADLSLMKVMLQARGFVGYRHGVDAVEDNRTWTLVELPHGHRPIELKWVFKLKKDEVGVVIMHKACLIAKSYVQ